MYMLLLMLAAGSPTKNCTRAYEHSSKVSELNRRFMNGRPAPNLHHAGVVMRGYDAAERVHSPHHPQWISRGGPLAGVASASLVNARMPFVFAGNRDLDKITGHVYACKRGERTLSHRRSLA